MNNKTGVVTFPCFTHEQVKEINKEIKKNIIKKEDPALSAYGSSNEMIFTFLFTMNFFLFAKTKEVL